MDIISKTGNLSSKHAFVPMKHNHRLMQSNSLLLENVQQYWRLIGRLIYLSFTRPDLAYSVHVLSQFLHATWHDIGMLLFVLFVTLMVVCVKKFFLALLWLVFFWLVCFWLGSMPSYSSFWDGVVNLSWAIAYFTEDKEKNYRI